MTIANLLVARLLAAMALGWVCTHTASGALVVLSLPVVALLSLPCARVDVDDAEWRLFVAAFRDALAEYHWSMKEAAAAMKLSAASLTHALNRDEQVDLVARMLLWPRELQRIFYVLRLVQLDLPDKIHRWAKVTAIVEARRSA